MTVTQDIVESWRHPRRVVRRLLERGPSEPFAFTLLATFLLVAFTAAAPNIVRQAHENTDSPLFQRLYAAALGLLMTVPFWYLLAAIGHLVARVVGGSGGYYGGRLALFWALVVVSPAILVQGMITGFVGSGPATAFTGTIVGVLFLMFWVVMLQEVEC